MAVPPTHVPFLPRTVEVMQAIKADTPAPQNCKIPVTLNGVRQPQNAVESLPWRGRRGPLNYSSRVRVAATRGNQPYSLCHPERSEAKAERSRRTPRSLRTDRGLNPFQPRTRKVDVRTLPCTNVERPPIVSRPELPHPALIFAARRLHYNPPNASASARPPRRSCHPHHS